jgi:hypothetical protein
MEPDYDPSEEQEESGAPSAVAVVIVMLVLWAAMSFIISLFVDTTATILYGNFIVVGLVSIAYQLALIYNRL